MIKTTETGLYGIKTPKIGLFGAKTPKQVPIVSKALKHGYLV